MRMFLDMRDYILHPAKYDPASLTDVEAKRKVNKQGADLIYGYFTDLIATREKDPSSDSIIRFLAADVGKVGKLRGRPNGTVIVWERAEFEN